MLYYLTSNGSRVGDNVVFVREPGNLFDPSCVKDSCVYVFLSFTGQSCVYYKSVKGLCSKVQGKCSVLLCTIMDFARITRVNAVYLRITQILRHICDITMSRR